MSLCPSLGWGEQPCVYLECICMCSWGKGGQVFTPTRFNEGCVLLCARVCITVCLLSCARVSWGSTHPKIGMDGWMEGSCRVYYELSSGFFIHYQPRVWEGNLRCEAFFAFKLPVWEERALFVVEHLTKLDIYSDIRSQTEQTEGFYQ